MEQIKSISELRALPYWSQFTEEQIRAQYAHNAIQLRQTAEKAKAKGKKIAGYTAEQWMERANHFDKMVNS